jgi:hypothetical protein
MGCRRSNHPGAYLTPFVALSGFLTLSALCSPPDLPALFHAGNAHGVRPSELSPSEEPYRLSAAAALMMFTRHSPYHTTRSCHAKRAEARCSHPDAVRLLLHGLITLRLTCRLGMPPPQGRPPAEAGDRHLPVSPQPLACRARFSPATEAAGEALPDLRLTAPGLAFDAHGHKARGLLRSVPDIPHGWPGLLPLAPGAEAPWARDPRPRQSQHHDHPTPRALGAEALSSPVTAWFAPSGDAPARSLHRVHAEAWPARGSSRLAGPATPTRARLASPGPKPVRGVTSRRPFLQATRRPSRVAPPRRSAALRHARADAPVPLPRP